MKKLIYTVYNDSNCWLRVSYIVFDEDGTIYERDKFTADYDRDLTLLQIKKEIVSIFKTKYGKEIQILNI